MQRVFRELKEYFDGKRRQFDVPLASRGTAFQQQVWQALQHIPFGTTASYGTIAQTIGKPKASRAVGSAVGRNPICILIPCHRIVPSDGTVGDFVAGKERKQQLLDLEKAAVTI